MKLSLPAKLLKAWLHLRQNGRCILCGEALDLSIPRHQYGSVTFEHVEPKVKGGAHGRSNLAVSHWECNRFRRDERRLKLIRPDLAVYPRLWLGWQRTPPKQRLGFQFPKRWMNREVVE